MRQSSPDQVRLATGSTDGTMAIWTLNDLLRTSRGSVVSPDSSLFCSTISEGVPMQAMAWHPSKDGIFATGGCSPDKFIRVWDFSRSTSTPPINDDEDSNELKHTIYCRQGITSLSWHDFSNGNDFCSEMVSTHADLYSGDCGENKMTIW